jgi:hypothetical protein
MPRFRSLEHAVRWDIAREQRRSRARLNTGLAAAAFVAFVLVTVLATTRLRSLNDDDAEGADPSLGGG